MIPKLLSLIEYNKKYRNMPDKYIYDECYILATIRNMKGLITTDRGGADGRYVEYEIPANQLKETFDYVFAEVIESEPRKYWVYEINKRMAKIQRGDFK